MALLIAPTSVLAAMPVVWCVGADGHRALEISVSGTGTHRHADHLTLGAQSAESSSLADADHADSDCEH